MRTRPNDLALPPERPDPWSANALHVGFRRFPSVSVISVAFSDDGFHHNRDGLASNRPAGIVLNQPLRARDRPARTPYCVLP
jgi:hypothetical protein